MSLMCKVLVRNIGTTLQRVGRVIALDRPDSVLPERSNHMDLISLNSSRAMVAFPSHAFPSNQCLPCDEVAFLSPIIAFNLDLHMSCLQSLVREGRETIMSLFEVKDSSDDKETKTSSLEVELKPLDSLPKFASHLRASFVKIPECGTIESLRKGFSVEAEDRQEMIDLALQDYFKVDRYLARGDIFRIHITWNCNSQLCIPCNQKTRENEMGNVIYFKVIGMEPADELVLRVNCRKTALVLGGSVPSAVPPDLLVGDMEKFVPVQGNTVKALGSILTPPLCPSSVSSKFRVAVLLHGLEGCGKRTTVRYVARRLGLHVVQYSCYDLMSSSEKKVSGALAHAFETAKRYLCK
ncbi:Peroxisome biogenesis protein [Thalictrum thalictroides]|uniref:Peroxisome biogenesis protein n=1 Tax=Thalictrum thalictroides TaxID=46969 RepID=A0A7J6V6W7_THATH|nr:Peroxisome biogenesis protein [Thalictrum thalictroides]